VKAVKVFYNLPRHSYRRLSMFDNSKKMENSTEDTWAHVDFDTYIQKYLAGNTQINECTCTNPKYKKEWDKL